MVLRRRLLLIGALLAFAASAGAQGILPPVAIPPTSLTSTTCTGTPGTGSGCVSLNVSGYASVAFQITGTFTATVTFEVSTDGATYQTLNVTPTNGTTPVTTATATGVWVGSVGGLKYARARVSAYTSGTVVVGAQAAASGGGSGGGGGGAASSVTINDPTVTTQKVAVNASGQLSITCANCSGSGASAVDESAFTQGTNSVAPMGGLFKTSYTALTSGQVGIAQVTANGGVFMNLDKIQGTNADVNSGTKSAGTLRVVLATDQPALTNALKVDGSAVTQPVSGSVSVSNSPAVTLTPELFSLGIQTAATANGNGAAGTTAGSSSIALTVNCAACAGGTTINFEGSEDTINFTPVLAQQTGTNTLATTTTTAGLTYWRIPVGGLASVRARISAYSAGTVTVTMSRTWGAWGTNVENVNVIGTVPISGTVTTTPPANASENLAQVAGTTTDTNSGTKSAGTLRVVLATDQPALTNKLLVTPDSVALPANQSVNLSQVAGTTTDTNSGTKSAGTIRVVLATDQPALTNKLLVTPDSVALPANQSVNVSQINGVTPLMGAGVTGTGAQRVNDVSAAATGAAPPASATYIGGLASGATGGFLTGPTVCDLSKPINISTATTTLMVTGVSGRQVRICAFHMLTAAANNVAWLEGTGATCGTGTAGMAGGTTAASGYNFAANGGLATGSGFGEVLTTATTGDSVCLITSAATQLSGFIKYTIF